MGININMNNQTKIKIYNIDHLLCSIVMNYTQHIPFSILYKLNRDNKRQAFFKERSLIGSMPIPHLKY